MLRQRVAVFGLAVAVLAACTGSASSGDTSDVAHVEGAAPPLSVLLEEGLALQGLFDTINDQYIAACMQKQGFRYEVPKRDSVLEGAVLPSRLTLEEAQQYGYSYTAPGEAVDDLSGVSAEFRAYFEGLSEAEGIAYAEAMLGPPDAEQIRVETLSGVTSMSTEGCIAEAAAVSTGDIETAIAWTGAYDRLQELGFYVWDRLLADPEWVAAQEAWSSCMGDRGYDVITPEDAFSLATSHPVGPVSDDESGAGEHVVSDWERQVAVADVTCATEVGLYETEDRLRFIHESSVLAENEDILFGWRETVDEMRRALPDELLRKLDEE